MPDTWNPVLYARDLDGDELPDAWFFRRKDGVLDFVDRPSRQPDGWDVASELLGRQAARDERLYLGIAFNRTLEALTFTGEGLRSQGQTMLRSELDLASLQIQTMRLAATDLFHPAIPVMGGMIDRGYQQLMDEIDRFYLKEAFVRAGGDVAAYFLGSQALKGLKSVSGVAFQKIISTEAGATAQAAYREYTRALKGSFARWTARFGNKAGASASRAAEALAKAETVSLARMTAAQQVSFSIRALSARARLQAAMAQALRGAAEVAKKSAQSWKYTAMVQSVQVLAEGASRPEIWDRDPLVMAERLISNEEFIQNFAYMTNETFWLSGITQYFQKRSTALVACALFSIVDTAAINYVIHDRIDPARSGFDATWQATVGNIQTRGDLLALQTFETLGRSVSHPGLKAVGWVVAIGSQGAGYYAYGKASQSVNEHGGAGEGDLRLIPVLASIAQ